MVINILFFTQANVILLGIHFYHYQRIGVSWETLSYKVLYESHFYYILICLSFPELSLVRLISRNCF